MREVPRKNYILYGVLCLFTFLIVFYAMSWYQTSKEYQKSHSVMLEFMSQIQEDEIQSFLLENPDILIYVSDSRDDTYRGFEKKLKNFILKEEIKTHFVYLDYSKVTDMNKIVNAYFSQDLLAKKLDLTYLPNVLIVEDGKVIDFLYKISDQPDVKDVQKFLEKYGVIVRD